MLYFNKLYYFQEKITFDDDAGNNNNKNEKINLKYFIEYYFFNLLKNCVLKFFKGISIKPKKLFIYLDYFYLHFLIIILYNSSFLKFECLMDIYCIDFVNNNFINRFLVSYSFWNIFLGFRIFLKLFTNIFGSIFSLNSFFFNSNWFEREVWDMFGLKFLFNFDLRRILTDYGFFGHPLRKNYPLIGFFELRFDYIYKLVIYEPTEMPQSYRYFLLGNPWKS